MMNMAYDFASLYPSRFSNQPEEPKVALKIIFYDEKIDKAVWCDRDRNAVLKAFRELDLAVDEIKIDEIMLMNEMATPARSGGGGGGGGGGGAG
jgi:hypothetical protein